MDCAAERECEGISLKKKNISVPAAPFFQALFGKYAI